MVKVGDKTIIRDLKRKDVDSMTKWGKHEDLTFLHYNFPYLNDKERNLWYKIKTQKSKKRCYAIEDLDKNLIGYISLRDIKFLKRESELGIVFDPKCIDKGYGTEALWNFLDIYFNKIKMKRLILRVAKFNKRAIRCYEKCGFIKTYEALEEFEEQYEDSEIRKNILNRYKDIIIKDNKLMTKYYYMHITNKIFVIHKKRMGMLITL